MIIHENPEIENMVLEGGFCMAIPVSVFLPADGGECIITAYRNVWDLCCEYEKNSSGDPFAPESLKKLTGGISPIMADLGYKYDRQNSRVIREYRLGKAAQFSSYFDLAEGFELKLVTSPAEVETLECLCLHKPDVDEDDPDSVCAVVIHDGEICACAGINDAFTDDTCEIYVETSKKHRRKGLGTAVVALLSEHLTMRGDIVGFKCAEDNFGSVGIAEKLCMTLSGRRFDMVCYSE